MNSKQMTYNERTMRNAQISDIVIGSILGFCIDIFRNFPESVAHFCYRVVCGLFAALTVAPFALYLLGWCGQNISWLSFLSAPTETPVMPVTYALCVMFAEPTISLIAKIFEIDLPKLIRKKINAKRKQSKRAD